MAGRITIDRREDGLSITIACPIRETSIETGHNFEVPDDETDTLTGDQRVESFIREHVIRHIDVAKCDCGDDLEAELDRMRGES